MVTFMAAVENTIIATAMPTVVADLSGFSLFSWAFSAHLLTQGVHLSRRNTQVSPASSPYNVVELIGADQTKPVRWLAPKRV